MTRPSYTEGRTNFDVFEQALTISREIGHRQSEANNLGQLGTAYRNLGQVEQALEFYEQALKISQEIGHRHGEEAFLCNLGLVYSDVGQAEAAIENYEQVLMIAREIDDIRGQGNILDNLGTAYSDLGEIEQALELPNHLQIRRVQSTLWTLLQGVFIRSLTILING